MAQGPDLHTHAAFVVDKVERRSIRLGEGYHLRFRAQARILIRSSNERTYILLNTQQALLVYGDRVDSPPKPDFNYNLDSGALIFACVNNHSTQPNSTARGGLSDKRMQVLYNTVQVSSLKIRGKEIPVPCKSLYNLLFLTQKYHLSTLSRGDRLPILPTILLPLLTHPPSYDKRFRRPAPTFSKWAKSVD